MIIGVVSDTHIPTAAHCLPPGVFSAFQGVDLILHAGDLVDAAVVDVLRGMAPVQAVAGNMDPPEIRKNLPFKRVIEKAGHRIGLIHGAGPVSDITERVKREFHDVSVIVFGHSHRPLVRREEGILLVNPGSPVSRPQAAPPSVAKLTLGPVVEAEIVYL